LAGCGPSLPDCPLPESLSLDSDSDDVLSLVSEDSEDSGGVDSVEELCVEELSVDSVEELSDEPVEAGSVDAGPEGCAVRARAAPPENNPANTTAITARCFFTAAIPSIASRLGSDHRHHSRGVPCPADGTLPKAADLQTAALRLRCEPRPPTRRKPRGELD
jgi:hypothetical protein